MDNKEIYNQQGTAWIYKNVDPFCELILLYFITNNFQ